MIPWFIIVALASLIAGFVPGIFLGVHITRGHLSYQAMLPPAPLPQPSLKTRSLARPSTERLSSRYPRDYEDEPLY